MLVPPFILFHLIIANLAIITGAVVLLRPKGTAKHKMLGRLWVVLMATTSITSFGIMEDGFSWIHGLALLILIDISFAFTAIRLKKVELHQLLMKSAYTLSLITGALAALLPGRFLNDAILDIITRF